MLTGTAGPHSEFSYTLSGGRESGSTGRQGTGNAGASYTGPYGTLNVNLGASGPSRQYSVGAAGGLIAHAGGLTPGPPLGDTVALVEAAHAAGAYINGNANSRIDRAGYAIVPSLVPYASNSVRLEPKGLPLDVELDSTSEQVAPYAESVVLVKFASQRRRSVQLKVHMPNDRPVPFGADVHNAKGLHVGYVGQAGRILARGVEDVDELTVSWGTGEADRCKVHIDRNTGASDYSVCRPGKGGNKGKDADQDKDQDKGRPDLEADTRPSARPIASNAVGTATGQWTRGD
jgi:outer membrane usher protein